MSTPKKRKVSLSFGKLEDVFDCAFQPIVEGRRSARLQNKRQVDCNNNCAAKKKTLKKSTKSKVSTTNGKNENVKYII